MSDFDMQTNAESEAVQQYQQALREKLPVHNCTETLKLCKTRIAEIDRTRRTEQIVGKYSYAMAAVLLVAILAAAYVNRGGVGMMDRNVLSQTLSASATSGSNISDGLNGDVANWLRNQLSVDPNSVRPESLRLKQMQRVFVDGHTMGRLVYTDGATDYVLVIAPETEQCDGEPVPGYPGLKQLEMNGVNIITWCDRGTSFALAAPKSTDALISLIR